MAILDTVKLAARIKHNLLDSEITRQIALARAEMIRAGVPSFVAESDTNELIVECIVQGTLKNISTDEKIRDAAASSFQYQLDNLRKHVWVEPEPTPEPEPDPEPEPTPEPEPDEDDDLEPDSEEDQDNGT